MPAERIQLISVIPPIKATSETEALDNRVLRGLLPSTIADADVTVDVAQTGRYRAPGLQRVGIRGLVQGKLKLLARMHGTAISLVTQIITKYFVNAMPTVPPKGRMGLATIAHVIDPNVPLALNGARLVKGDLVPIYFHVQGQRLEGLEGIFYVKQRKALPPNSPIAFTKTGVIVADPALDAKTGLEIMTGNFSLTPSDTMTFPDYEVEMSYQFVLTDNMGRTYTVATGFFTVYNPL
jgi:hypothetical protein